jgi:exodeoxyribonuclease VII small subunit
MALPTTPSRELFQPVRNGCCEEMRTVNESSDMPATVPEGSFETVYEQLERAVAQLENGGLSLEQSIEVYETGMRLARRCKEMLDAAELRVTEIEREMSAAAIALPFEEEA